MYGFIIFQEIVYFLLYIIFYYILFFIIFQEILSSNHNFNSLFLQNISVN